MKKIATVMLVALIALSAWSIPRLIHFNVSAEDGLPQGEVSIEIKPSTEDTVNPQYEIPLYEGWNLIGIPFIPDDPSIEIVLSEIIDCVECVWAFDGQTKTWSSYLPAVPKLGDLTEMVAGRGYWILVNTNVTLRAPT